MEFWVFLFILTASFFVIVLVYMIYFYSQKKRLSNLEKILIKHTHEFQQALKQIVARQKETEPYSKEPFLTGLMDLAKEIDQLNLKKDQILKEYIQFRQEVRKIKQGKLAALGIRWNIFALNKLVKQAEKLDQQIIELNKILGNLHDRFDEVKEYPWSVALQVRELMEYYQQARKITQNLTMLGLHGEEVDQHIYNLDEIQKDISTIPLYFLVDRREQVLEEVDLNDLRLVVKIAQNRLPEVIRIIRNAESWNNKILSLNLEIDIAQKQIARFMDEISFHPKEINIDEVKAKVEEWNAEIGKIKGSLKEISLFDLDELPRTISNVILKLQELQKQLQKERRLLTNFQNLMKQNLEMKSDIEKILACFEDNKNLRIQWSQCSPLYQQVQTQLSEINTISQPYTYEMLMEGVQKAQVVFSGLKPLRAKMQQTLQDFNALLSARERFFQSNWDAFIEKAKEVENHLLEYHPRNFTHRDWVMNYSKRRVEMDSRYFQMRNILEREFIDENQVTEIKNNLLELINTLETFQDQTNQLLDEYYTIKSQEQQATELLRNSRRDFLRITALVTSHPVLREKAEKEIVQYDHQFDLREAEIQDKQKDLVGKKLQRTLELVAAIEQAGNRWLKIIEKEAWSIANGLSERILEIEEVLQISDPILVRGKELVNQRDTILGKNLQEQKVYRFEELLLEMKRRFDYWSECNSLSKQIIEQIELPVLGVYQECVGLKREAEQRLKQLEGNLPDQRQWPPNSIELSHERRELQILEDKWEYLKEQPYPTIQIVRLLSDLNGGYRGLISKFIQYQQWIQQEQNRIQRIEEDIQRLDRQWEMQANRYNYLPEIYRQIYELRLKNQEELESIRRYWLTNTSRKSPAMDYDIVLKKLIEISRNLATARIAIKTADGRFESMDINGQLMMKT